MNPATAFDAVAVRYDELWTDTAAGRAQRKQVWWRIDPIFHAGDRILDIGCGTGADAAHFVARGVNVHAIDASPAMVGIARRVAQAVPPARAGGTACPTFTAELRRAEEIAAVPGTFDGAISNFGALNCVSDVAPVARALAGRVRCGGCVAVCTIGRFCAWETLYYAARGQFRKAFRRLRGSAPSSLGITVHCHSVAELRAAFEPGFVLERWMGIGLCVPPSYVRLPESLTGACHALDRVLARLPLLRALADHRLLIFVRK